MTIETVYLSQKAKDQLIKIKRATGIQNWNILCRWAFCLSLADKTIPPTVAISQEEHAIEMTWKVFGGQEHDIYLSMLKSRCKKDQIILDRDNLTQQLRRHLHRGIVRMSDKNYIGNIGALIKVNEEKYIQ